MPDFDVHVALDQVAFERLATALGPNRDAEALTQLIARAGASELLAQASGQAVFTSIADLRSFRVLCLLQQGITMPEAEALVAIIFKVPATSARRLVQAAVARYDVELDASVDTAVRAVLDAGNWDQDAGRWRIRPGSAFVRSRMRQLLENNAIIEPTRASVAGEWLFAEESLNALRDALGLEPVHHADP